MLSYDRTRVPLEEGKKGASPRLKNAVWLIAIIVLLVLIAI